MSTYYYLRDLSESNDPYILSAVNNDEEDYLTALVNWKRYYFNQRLIVNGYVFLEQVCNSFGLETTYVDSVVGWVYDSKNGDGFIDLRYRVIEREDGSKRYVIEIRM